MEPIMTFEGYQIVEDTKKSNDLLNDFYEQMGYVVSDPHHAKGSATPSAQDHSVSETGKR
nr:hypothetical protein [Mucilaginibacter sp. SP1R1]MBB6149594.1 hypothetical protein [Mucilaginibacter sp. SP1R1]